MSERVTAEARARRRMRASEQMRVCACTHTRSTARRTLGRARTFRAELQSTPAPSASCARVAAIGRPPWWGGSERSQSLSEPSPQTDASTCSLCSDHAQSFTASLVISRAAGASAGGAGGGPVGRTSRTSCAPLPTMPKLAALETASRPSSYGDHASDVPAKSSGALARRPTTGPAGKTAAMLLFAF